MNETTGAVLFAMPFLLGFLLFTIVPMGMSLYYSFTDFNILRAPTFVGLDNYVRMLTDERLFSSMRATFYFAFTSVPLRLLVALLVALMLLKSTKMTGVYRAMYYLPSILGASVAVAVLWRQMFFVTGTVNRLLDVIGLNRDFAWLGDTRTAIWTLILLAAWQFGSAMLIFLSSLKQIPETYYEAARIDGAGKLRIFFKITLPLLTPTIFFNLVMQMINGFLAFTQAFLVTQGGPADTTNFFSLYMFNHAFAWGNAGYAAALAWMMLIMLGTFTGILFLTKRFWVYEGGFS
ncbi:MAG: sugar ABC transporter permease [Defluviitaleaceae bacterium]|nr:sugar ABC transporter permease [Defluviitaleaceae bacterium]